MRRAITALAMLAATGSAAQAAPLAKHVFGAAETPSAQTPAPIGGYSKGCLAGGVAIADTGPGWQRVRLEHNRNWAHPEAAAFLERFAARAREAGWPSLLVGDVSQPRGGPMNSGHASHQVGLDLDIWFRPGAETPVPQAERRGMRSASVVAGNRRGVNGAWSAVHAAILRAAAEDPAVARVFVNAAIKRELCETMPEPREWLRRIRPWWGHDAHFHVRLACPDGAGLCEGQPPPPAGDGCDETLAWWFTDEALNPPKPDKPKPRARDVMTLADLPASCRTVADAP